MATNLPSYTKPQRENAIQHGEALVTVDVEMRHVKGQGFGRVTFAGPWPVDIAKRLFQTVNELHGEVAKAHKAKGKKK